MLIRCDASSIIGYGHLVRCLCLAKQLRLSDYIPLFCIRTPEKDLVSSTCGDFPVFFLPDLKSSNEYDLNMDWQSPWPSCLQTEDAYSCADCFRKSGIEQLDWIISDHYCLDSIWELQMLHEFCQEGQSKLLIIDDFANRAHHCSILVNQNIIPENGLSAYSELVNPACMLLMGPMYALLDQSYQILRREISFRSNLQRVLIYFGGGKVDQLINYSLTTFQAHQLKAIHIDLVTHPNHSFSESTLALMDSHKHLRHYTSLPTLSGLISRADIAIGAAGSTTWERFCLALPSILFLTDLNQAMVADFCKHTDSAFVTSTLSQDELNEHTLNLSDTLTLRRMSELCHSYCDGLGAQRVVACMMDF